jgi:hypothetical protein
MKSAKYLQTLGAVAIACLVLEYFISSRTAQAFIGFLGAVSCVFLLRKAYIAGEQPNPLGKDRDFAGGPALRDLFRCGLSALGLLIWAVAFGLSIRYRFIADTWTVAHVLLFFIPFVLLLATFAFFVIRCTFRTLFGVTRNFS